MEEQLKIKERYQAKLDIVNKLLENSLIPAHQRAILKIRKDFYENKLYNM